MRHHSPRVRQADNCPASVPEDQGREVVRQPKSYPRLMRANPVVGLRHVAVVAQGLIAVRPPSAPQVLIELPAADVGSKERPPMNVTIPISVIESQESPIRFSAALACRAVALERFGTEFFTVPECPLPISLWVSLPPGPLVLAAAFFARVGRARIAGQRVRTAVLAFLQTFAWGAFPTSGAQARSDARVVTSLHLGGASKGFGLDTGGTLNTPVGRLCLAASGTEASVLQAEVSRCVWHRSRPRLLGDVRHDLIRGGASRADQIRMSPERRQSAAQAGELLTEHAAGRPLHRPHDAVRRIGWQATQEEVDVVRLDGHLDDLPRMHGGNLPDQLAEALSNRPLKHRPPVLRTPDQMVDQEVARMTAALVVHENSRPHQGYILPPTAACPAQRPVALRTIRIPPPAEAEGFLRRFW